MREGRTRAGPCPAMGIFSRPVRTLAAHCGREAHQYAESRPSGAPTTDGTAFASGQSDVPFKEA
jgi:hypothetical protein